VHALGETILGHGHGSLLKDEMGASVNRNEIVLEVRFIYGCELSTSLSIILHSNGATVPLLAYMIGLRGL